MFLLTGLPQLIMFLTHHIPIMLYKFPRFPQIMKSFSPRYFLLISSIYKLLSCVSEAWLAVILSLDTLNYLYYLFSIWLHSICLSSNFDI